MILFLQRMVCICCLLQHWWAMNKVNTTTTTTYGIPTPRNLSWQKFSHFLALQVTQLYFLLVTWVPRQYHKFINGVKLEKVAEINADKYFLCK